MEADPTYHLVLVAQWPDSRAFFAMPAERMPVTYAEGVALTQEVIDRIEWDRFDGIPEALFALYSRRFVNPQTLAAHVNQGGGYGRPLVDRMQVLSKDALIRLLLYP